MLQPSAADRLTEQERAELASVVARLGVNGAARRYGMSRWAISSLLAGSERPGTRALYRAQRGSPSEPPHAA
jgi:hypothetical protein